VLLALLLAACGPEEAPVVDAGFLDAGQARSRDAGELDAAEVREEDAAVPALDGGVIEPPSAIAPDGANPGEVPAPDGDTAVRARDDADAGSGRRLPGEGRRRKAEISRAARDLARLPADGSRQSEEGRAAREGGEGRPGGLASILVIASEAKQ
jgi:hypothetical protein